MKIAVRLDDINPRMDLRRFNDVKRMLDRYGVCPLIGVVPNNRDDGIAPAKEAIKDYDQMLIKLKNAGWIIAMHGVTHCYLDISKNKSEFCGLSYDKQYELLKMGKECLEKTIGDEVCTFFAPSNRHDELTVAALKNLGFTHMSYGENDNVFGEDMIYIPIARGIRQVIRLFRFYKKRNGITTLVIHPNTTSDKLLARYDKLLGAIYKEHRLVNYGDVLLEEPHDKNLKWIREQKTMNTIESFLSELKGCVVLRGKKEQRQSKKNV